MKKRMLGLVMAMLAVIVGYLCIYSPLHDAQTHAEHVSLSMKGAFMFPPILAFGLIYILKGEEAEVLLGNRENGITPLGWVVAIVTLIFGAVIYFWVKSEVERLGYDFNYHGS